MYAVIETGGKQYKVAEGDTIAVEKLETPVGESVEIPAVRLVVDGDKVVTDKKRLDKFKVLGTVTAQKRAAKIRVFKMKRRKGYRRHAGHRQALTEILITGIRTEKARKKT
jgi:large subunit ribosomal protein L21